MKLELLTMEAGDRRTPYRVAYPLPFSPVLLTGLFPRQAELDMLAETELNLHPWKPLLAVVAEKDKLPDYKGSGIRAVG